MVMVEFGTSSASRGLVRVIVRVLGYGFGVRGRKTSCFHFVGLRGSSLRSLMCEAKKPEVPRQLPSRVQSISCKDESAPERFKPQPNNDIYGGAAGQVFFDFFKLSLLLLK